MKVREEISEAVVKRYKKSSKKEKGKILDEFRQLSRILCLAHLFSSKS